MNPKIYLAEKLPLKIKTYYQDEIGKIFFKAGIKTPRNPLPKYVFENESVEQVFIRRVNNLLMNLKDEDEVITLEPIKINTVGSRKYDVIKQNIYSKTGINIHQKMKKV